MSAEPIYLDVEILDEYADDTCCSVCGDDIEPGDLVVWHPWPEISKNAIQDAHPGCAVRNGYRLRYPDEPSPASTEREAS